MNSMNLNLGNATPNTEYKPSTNAYEE